MKFSTINPATEEVIAEYEMMPPDEVFSVCRGAQEAYLSWRRTEVMERAELLSRLASVLRHNVSRYAGYITTEMGKPIRQSEVEVEKCAWCAEVYADNAADWLEAEEVEADGVLHQVSFEPTGAILSIMPWNFPFWQAFRFAIPTLLAGNVSILKHANNVPQCAFAIEETFQKAGFPENTFRNILADHDTVAEVIRSDLIAGVSLTGSTRAGIRVGELAGSSLKKAVLELGGSDPFIVLDDSVLSIAAQNAISGRMLNAGQSCIAAKRFIVLRSVAEQFTEAFAEQAQQMIVGDPSDEKTEMGPLVNEAALKEIEEQVADAVDKGGKIAAGGKRLNRKGYFFQPTVISETKPEMRCVTEEVFGPVAAVIVVDDDAEAIKIANNTEFGLGASVWSQDLERARKIARELETGAVFINSIVKSDPRMPFGGVKKSGIGRELSKYGMREFVNVKALNVYEHK
jgi:acyl-CoA reductase-like NAD-dependent aldehyde dehydrogenase